MKAIAVLIVSLAVFLTSSAAIELDDPDFGEFESIELSDLEHLSKEEEDCDRHQSWHGRVHRDADKIRAAINGALHHFHLYDRNRTSWAWRNVFANFETERGHLRVFTYCDVAIIFSFRSNANASGTYVGRGRPVRFHGSGVFGFGLKFRIDEARHHYHVSFDRGLARWRHGYIRPRIDNRQFKRELAEHLLVDFKREAARAAEKEIKRLLGSGTTPTPTFSTTRR